MTRKGTPSRRDRIIVLLNTLNDMREPERTPNTPGGKPSSRALTFHDLYHAGSYHQLEHCLTSLKTRAPKIHWHTVRVYVDRNPVTDTGKSLSPRKANLGVQYLEKTMPPFVMVPTEILENHGYTVSTSARHKAAA